MLLAEIIPSTPLRILLVEDQPINQKVALRLLQQLGYKADLASDGGEAVAALRMHTYDLVLMDVQMPVMDGFEATRQIIAEHGDKRPRIVAMTANTQPGDVGECLRAGMDGYVAKPVRLIDLQAAIEREPGGSSEDYEMLASLRELEAEAGPELVKELIGMYLKDAPARITAMKTALAQRDGKTLQREAHTLKSSSATLGGQATADACQVVETRARDLEFEEAAAALPAIEQLLLRFSPLLAHELDDA